MTKWRIKRGEKIAGGVPSSKVRQLATAGKLKKTDLLSREGTDKWVRAGSVEGLWQKTPPNQSTTAPAKDQEKSQTVTSSSPATAENVAETTPVQTEDVLGKEEVHPQEEATNIVDRQETSDAAPQQEVAKKPKRKWLMPLFAGGIGGFLLLGVLSLLIAREADRDKQSTTRTQRSNINRRQHQRAQYNTSSKLSLTQDFFPPNTARNFEYTSQKFANNTTVAVYRKSIVEKWNTETELYFHEKSLRNYGQKVSYRINNGFVQLKGKDNWFRFLKLDAKAGESWTPGDGRDETLDWTGKGEIKLLGFKTIDSTDVAVVEFTAQPELPVPSYLVPAALDFGIMEDGSGPIQGKVRYELGDGLGLLRADAIVPKGTRHRSGAGRDNSEWIFATRKRNGNQKNNDTGK